MSRLPSSPLEVYRFISDDTHPCKSYTNEFPSPLEVDRFISLMLSMVCLKFKSCFRPLSRYIGLYRADGFDAKFKEFKFPSPPEVDRFISVEKKDPSKDPAFPSPLEVDRFIS